MSDTKHATSAGNSADSGHADHEHVGHVVDVKILYGVLMALLFLTVLTVAVTYLDLNEIGGRGLNIAVAMVIATVKATLVALFFMHLWWDKRFNLVLLVCSIAFVGLFISFAMMDKLEYAPSLDKGDAPKVIEKLESGG